MACTLPDKIGFVGVTADPGVELLFLANAAAGATLVVMGRIHRTIIRQAEQLFGNGVEQRAGVALLEVAAAAAADQQGVAGEDHGLVGQHITHATVGMARSGTGLQFDTLHTKALTMVQGQVDMFCLNHPGRGDLAAGVLFEQPGGGDVIGMGMGVDHQLQVQVEFTQERQIALHLFIDRVDQQRFAALLIGQQIAVGG